MRKFIKRLRCGLLGLYLAGLFSWYQAGAQYINSNAPVSPIPVPPMPSNLLPGKEAPQVTDIWVVFKTHCDLGYTMSAEAVLKKYREDMMDNAIRLIDADKAKPSADRFKWTIAGWPMKGAILGPEQTPERKIKVEQAIRDGAISIHALSATLESDVMEQEDYVRSLIFSSKLARDYGHKLPIAAKMTDVPAHSWLLPTLLHHAGIKLYKLAATIQISLYDFRSFFGVRTSLTGRKEHGVNAYVFGALRMA